MCWSCSPRRLEQGDRPPARHLRQHGEIPRPLDRRQARRRRTDRRGGPRAAARAGAFVSDNARTPVTASSPHARRTCGEDKSQPYRTPALLGYRRGVRPDSWPLRARGASLRSVSLKRRVRTHGRNRIHGRPRPGGRPQSLREVHGHGRWFIRRVDSQSRTHVLGQQLQCSSVPHAMVCRLAAELPGLADIADFPPFVRADAADNAVEPIRSLPVVRPRSPSGPKRSQCRIDP